MAYKPIYNYFYKNGAAPGKPVYGILDKQAQLNNALYNTQYTDAGTGGDAREFEFWDEPNTGQIGADSAAPIPVEQMERADTFSLGGYNPGSYGVTQGQIGNAPTYNSQWDDELQSIYNRIMNREDFSFDLNGNALYNQYKDQYINQGKLAMQDTMGQAAALTGGYGSSYGQQVGQQAYNSYLQQLNNVVPEIYGAELDQYNQEGQELMNQYSITSGLKNDEYGMYRDATSDYRADRDYLSGQEQLQYNRGYQQYQDQQSQQDENYNKLLQLMTTTGFEPTEGDLAAAGMSAYEASKWKEYIAEQNKPRGGGGPVEKPLKVLEDPEVMEEARLAYNSGGDAALEIVLGRYPNYDLGEIYEYISNVGSYTPPKPTPVQKPGARYRGVGTAR